jgi:hypothetical protein
MAELSEEAKAEIRDAIRILKEDGVHVHKTYPAFLKAQKDAEEAEKNKPPETGDGKPPPVKEKPAPEYDEVVGLWGTRRVPRKPADDTAAG